MLPPPETLLGLRPPLLGVASQFGTIPLSAFGQLSAAASVQTALLQQQLAQAAQAQRNVQMQQALAVQQQQSSIPDVKPTLPLPSIQTLAKPSKSLSNIQAEALAKIQQAMAVHKAVSSPGQPQQHNVSSSQQPTSSTSDAPDPSTGPDDVASSSTNSFECTYRLCRSRFSTMQELHAHIKMVHQGSCYVCNDCGKTFGSYMGLKFHSSKHTGKFRFNCPQCAKGFNRVEQYQSHMNMHEGHGFVCLRCNKVFVHKAKLVQHSKSCTA